MRPANSVEQQLLPGSHLGLPGSGKNSPSSNWMSGGVGCTLGVQPETAMKVNRKIASAKHFMNVSLDKERCRDATHNWQTQATTANTIDARRAITILTD